MSVETGVAGWQIERRRGSVAELHAPAVPETATPTIWLMDPADDALVLGSRQRDVVVAPERLASRGLSLVHRRSGGGAVIIDASTRWIDVLVPAAGPAWGSDLTEAFRVVGGCWHRAFATHDLETELWNDRPTRSDLADAVCFAGMGWGELALSQAAGGGLDGIKVLGLSQRRTRWGARIQCMIVNRDHTGEVAGLLELGEHPQHAPPNLDTDLFSEEKLNAVAQSFLAEVTGG